LSENAELTDAANAALDALPGDASVAKLREAAQGKVSGKPKGEGRKPRMVDLAVEMLRERGPMHYKDLTKALLEGGFKSKGQTPAQTLSAALIRHPDAERVAPGVYKAKESSDG
jgi:hypothetical protein